MDSSVLPEDKIWFLRVCHHILNAVYLVGTAAAEGVSWYWQARILLNIKI